MQRKFFQIVILLSFCALSNSVYGQTRSDQNWWMGNGATGIQFSQPGDTARLVTRPTANIGGYGPAGGAVASDPSTGGLLFYTDGNTVFDMTHRPMPNGTTIGGSALGNQPAVVALVPGSTTRYFVITNSATTASAGQIRLTEVDMTLPGNNFTNPNFPAPPLGDVGPIKAQDIAGLGNESEAMILIPHRNRTDYWLITHQRGTSTFNVSAVTATGVAPIAPPPIPDEAPFTFNAAHFAYDSVTNTLAVAPSDINKSITTYSFNISTGVLEFDEVVFNSAVTTAVPNSAIYDLEWSSNGEFLYASRQNLLLQFDMINNNVSPDTVNTQTLVQSYGLQMGPDSAIYHIYQQTAGGPLLVGRINNPDTTAIATNYEPLPFGSVDFGALQFPQFLPDHRILLTVDFTSVGSCQNAPISFFPTVTPAADSLRWNFGDTANGSSNQWAPTYTYAESGSFIVTVTAYLAGDSVVYQEPLNVTSFDTQLSLVQDTTACSCELTFPKNPPPSPPVYSDGSPCNAFALTATTSGTAPTSVQWYGPGGALAGQTTLTLSPVDSAGFYYVIAGNGTCQTHAGVNIKEYGVEDQRANIWLFGQQGGIDFNNLDSGPVAFQSTFASNEGTAVISDQNGQVILSTNGEQVFNRLGAPSPLLPTGLGGSQNATQSSLIIPFPGDPTLYYVFVTQEVYPPVAPGYELRYAVFDTKLNLYGELVALDGGSTYSNVLFTKNTERITGNENWLIAHEYGTNNFRAYPITPQGIGAPVISSIGSDHSLAVKQNAEGYMKLGDNGVLAVALSTPGVSNVVEIFDFVDSTGAVTNFRQVDLAQPNGQVYGLEFSGSGRKLYVSTMGGQNALHEFVYDSTAGTYIAKFPVVTPGAEIGAIQTGPDGNIYVATNGSGSLSTITQNEDPDLPSTFNENEFGLNGGTSTLGLPNFIQNLNDALMAPSISFTSACEDEAILFQGTGTDAIDTLTWQFGDGSSERGVNLTEVEHTYTEPGEYQVILTISNRCLGVVNVIDTLIVIHRVPELLPGTVTLCDTSTPAQLTAVDPADPDIGGFTFAWSSGETTNTISPQTGGTYSATVTTAEGCVATRSDYTVNDNRPQVELGPDQTICENSSAVVFDAANPGATYLWTENGVDVTPVTPDDPAIFRFVPSDPGTFVIKLLIDDPFTGCSIRDSVTLVVNPDATFTTSFQDPSVCGAADGEINITITATGTFIWTVMRDPVLESSGDVTGPTGPINVPGLRASAYNVNVTNQVTGCFDRTTVGLTDADFVVTIQRAQSCNDPTTGQMPIQLTVAPPQPSFVYRILAAATTAQIGTDQTVVGDADGVVITPQVNNGNYVAEVESGGCTAVSPITPIQQDTEVPIDEVILDECNPVRLEVVAPDADVLILWNGPGLNPLGETTAVVTPTLTTAGVYEYDLHLESSNFCSKDTVIAVTFDPASAAVLEQSDACSDVVTLTATQPTGNDYVYQWWRNTATPAQGGSQVSAGQSLQLSEADNGAVYQVLARSTLTGCILESNELAAGVLGEFTVDLTNDQACQGRDFTLTAEAVPFPDAFVWFYSANTATPAFVQEENQFNTSLTVTDDRSGFYKVTVQRSVGAFVCNASDSVQIVVSPVTAGNLVDQGVICPDPANTDPTTSIIQLDAGPGFLSYSWSKDGELLEDEIEQVYEATDVGVYEVALVNAYNCPSTDRTTLVDECDPKITGPNAFRPGGLNTEFFLFTFFIADEDFEIFIFNRWGEMVFYSPDKAFRWNGGYKNNSGQILPPGTYTYLVKYRSSYRPEDGIKEHRNGVVLLK